MVRVKLSAAKSTGVQLTQKAKRKGANCQELILSRSEIVTAGHRADHIWQDAKHIGDERPDHRGRYKKIYELPWVVNPNTPDCINPHVCYNKHILHLQLIPHVFLKTLTREQRQARDPLYRRYVIQMAEKCQLDDAGIAFYFYNILHFS